MRKFKQDNQSDPFGIFSELLSKGVKKIKEEVSSLTTTKEKTINQNISISFPSSLSYFEIKEIMEKIPDTLVNQILNEINSNNRPKKNTYEQVLRFYTKRSSGTLKLSVIDTVISSIQKVLGSLVHGFGDFNYNFHLQTAYLAYVWVDMLISLKKVHGNSWSSTIIAKIAIAILVAIIQVIHKEFIASKAISLGYSAYGSIGDLIENAPNDIKKFLPSFLQSNNYLTWHRELGQNSSINNLSMAQAINMLYTFRIGDTFATQLVSNDYYSDDLLKEIAYSLSPIPVQNEQYRLVNLFPDGKYYSI